MAGQVGREEAVFGLDWSKGREIMGAGVETKA